MSADTILGIDPGTRFIGIAILRGGLLVHWQVQNFQGKWSEDKLVRIQKAILKHIERNNVTRIAIKIPDKLPNTKAFHQVLGSINIIAGERCNRIPYFTLKELKKAYTGYAKCSLKTYHEQVVKKYSELWLEYQKEQRNEEGYYFKIFEAVAAAGMIG